jgi:hypothetical protein
MSPLELDALVDRVVAEESATLHESFIHGAEFAVTRMDSPRHRRLHRLECAVMDQYLDRAALWTDARRARLAADSRYRPALPTLFTREAARELIDVRGCRVCWPNLHGRDPAPLRRLRARGLRAKHTGRILSTDAGESLGSISRVSARTGPDLFGRPADAIEVMTSSRVFAYAPMEDVFLWNLPPDAEVIERKFRLFQLLGADLAPAE